jgi:hypothetical protein
MTGPRLGLGIRVEMGMETRMGLGTPCLLTTRAR